MQDYRLLCCHEAPYDGRYFLVRGNKRRWVLSQNHMAAYSLKQEDVEVVSPDYLSTFELSARLPDPAVKYDPPTMSISEMHEFVGNQLLGTGIEFGAASSPFPVPIESDVEYADFYDHSLSSSPYFTNVYYARSEYVKCKYQANLETIEGIPDSSLNFMIACHVIEHVRNPLLAIESAWNKLKPGGKLVLLVPHRDLTFDRNRDLTTLEHLILDYERPLKERDFMHFVDFYEKAFPDPDPFEKGLTEFNSKYSDIHFHTWNEETFLKMVVYFSENIKKWTEINYYPHLPNEHANEFYFILQK